MKIYIEASSLKNKNTGIARVVTEIISFLEKSNIKYIKIEPSNIVYRNTIFNFFYFNIYIYFYCKRKLDKDDIFLIPNNMGKFFHLPHKNCFIIVHDLIPLYKKIGYSFFKKMIYRIKMSRIRKARKIIAISEYVKKQILNTYNIPANKIEVLYWFSYFTKQLAKNECKEKYNRHIPFFLSIGTGEPRKNIEYVIKNWEKVYENKYNLLLFGKEWRKGIHKKLNELIEKNEMKEYIYLLGSVSEEDLNYLYSQSLAFIFPSVEEGFGLPPLEALTCKTKIILPKTPVNFELFKELALFYSIGNDNEFKTAVCNSINFSIDENIYRKKIDEFSLDNFYEKLSNIFINA